MFTTYIETTTTVPTFENLTVTQKNAITDAYTFSDSPTYIKHNVIGVTTSIAIEAIKRIKQVECFCKTQASTATSLTNLRTLAKEQFTTCSAGAMDYLVGKIVGYADGTGTATFIYWKEGVLGTYA